MLIGENDPAVEVIESTGALDLRPGGLLSADGSGTRTVVVSGPNDLIELRRVVETAIGVGVWPVSPCGRGEVSASSMPLERPAAALALLLALEGLIERRSPWGNWKTVVETMAPAVGALDRLTIEAMIIKPVV